MTSSHDETYSVVVPTGPDLSSLLPEMMAPPPPPPKIETRVRTVTTVSQEPETIVNRDVTVGRLARTQGGEIVRASVSTAGPGYCPT